MLVTEVKIEDGLLVSIKILFNFPRFLGNVKILNNDFEKTILQASENDFIFLDPPYKPGEKDLNELHYINGNSFIKNRFDYLKP